MPGGPVLEVRGAGVVHVLGDGIGRPVAGILAQGQQLGFRVLIFIAGADAGIEGDVHGKSRPFYLSTYRQDANKNTTPRGCVSARSGVWQCWRSTHREYTTRRQGQMPVERKGYEDGSLGMSGTARLARSKCVTIQSFSVSPSAWAAACQVRGVITLRMGDSGIKVEVHFRHFAGNRSMARDGVLQETYLPTDCISFCHQPTAYTQAGKSGTIVQDAFFPTGDSNTNTTVAG